MSADAASLLPLWGIDPSSRLSRLERGESNRTYRVDAADGTYALRIYGDRATGPVRFEHELLVALAGVELPFATPVPVALAAGGTVAVAEEPAGPRLAALFRWIPGQNPDDDDVAAMALGGAALGRLDRALAEVRTTLGPPAFGGDITRVHPAVTDLASLGELDDEARAYVRRAADRAARGYAGLPQQLVHGDFAFGNVLLEGGRVSGMLDFEFAGVDARAMELAAALVIVLSKGNGEALWRPFVRAYLATHPLSAPERAAIPDLIVARCAVVLVWWIGRHRMDATPHERLERHVRRALVLEEWVRLRRRELVDALGR